MEKRNIDLHIHTIYSDGEKSPAEICEIIEEKGIKVFSITDHDTILGAKKVKAKKGILYIPGVELTAKVKVGREHILGYDIDLENEQLNAVLERKKQMDLDNLFLSYEALQKDYGIVFPKQEMDTIIDKVGNVGRVDLSNLLRKYGYAASQDEAFQKYLNPIREKVRSFQKGLTEEECIRLIKDANGYVSLAHAVSLDPRFSDLKNLRMAYVELKHRLLQMKKIGLDAIEIQHISHSNPFREMLVSLANELSLLESGGTDYHGENIKPGVEIGSGYHGNVAIKKLSLVDEIIKNRL